MIANEDFKLKLVDYHDNFKEKSRTYDQSDQHGSELEALLDRFSHFVTNESNKEAWNRLDQQELGLLDGFVSEIREASALCVAMMEKYRAVRLRSGYAAIADYFKNIEACIEKEFGGFSILPESKVLLIGSGSFPMTPLLIAKRTGAEVVGIDIDEEAITLGREVIALLGSGLPIRLENLPAEQLPYAREATHIIFSSTVGKKYELLDRLHSITNEHVVVAMRYGDGLKSLFNYPMQEIEWGKWRLSDRILRPDQIFDVALYTKI